MRLAERLVAFAATIAAPLALRLLPLPRALVLLDRWPVVRGSGAHPVALASRTQRWLNRGFGLWRSTCLTRSAVLYAMLRQHGYRPLLHLGVMGSENSFEAHAWISLAGIPIADAPQNVERFRPLWMHGG